MFCCLPSSVSAIILFKLPMVTCLPMLLKTAQDFLLHLLKRKLLIFIFFLENKSVE